MPASTTPDFIPYDGWENDLNAIVRALMADPHLTPTLAKSAQNLSTALRPPHVHDWRWAHLPTGVDLRKYPYRTATVQCIAPGCDLGAHQYVTVESPEDLPVYEGPDPLSLRGRSAS